MRPDLGRRVGSIPFATWILALAALEANAARARCEEPPKYPIDEAGREELRRLAQAAKGLDNVEARYDIDFDVAKVWAMAGEPAAARECLRRAARDAEAITIPELRAFCFANIAQGLAALGDRDGAREALRAAHEAAEKVPLGDRVFDLAAIAERERDLGDLDAARSTFARAARVANSIRDRDDRADALGDLIGTHLHGALLDDALRLAESAFGGRRTSAPYFFRRIADDLDAKDARACDRVLSWLRTLPRDERRTVERDAKIRAGIARIEAKRGHLDVAVEESRRVVADDPTEGSELLAEIAGALHDAGDRPGALKILAEADEAVHAAGAPSYIALGRLARAWIRAGDLDRAGVAIAEIRDWKPPKLPPIPPGMQVFPDAARISRYIDRLLKESQPLHEQSRDGTLCKSLTDLAVAQARRGDRAAARDSFREALDVVDRLPKGELLIFGRYAILRMIAEAQARAGEVDAALATARLIAGRDQRGDALLDIVQARLRAGDLAGAERLAETYADEARDSAVLAIATTRARRGDLAGALKRIRGLTNPSNRARGFRAVAEEFMARGGTGSRREGGGM